MITANTMNARNVAANHTMKSSVSFIYSPSANASMYMQYRTHANARTSSSATSAKMLAV